MEKTNQVFRSEIILNDRIYKNNLYDLLKVTAAKPVELKNKETYTCDFIPRTDKIYIPKGRSNIMDKVKTVRDVRTSFENDTYTYLTNDLQSQEKYLLEKIREGFSRNENTQNFAIKILNSDTPISRSAWQMSVNINPHHFKHTQQFVLWNGKFIQVNGSKGGKNKLIYNYDLATTKIPLQVKKKLIKNKISPRIKGLLRNSLGIKFKPEPLGRKKFLDDSHQKYHGDIELVVGLIVKPIGTTIEPIKTHAVSNLRLENGVVTEKWAEFADSALGKIDKSNMRLLNEDDMTLFDLKHIWDQQRILMRKDLDKLHSTPSVMKTFRGDESFSKAQLNILPELEDKVNKKNKNAVEININHDTMFTANKDVEQPTVEKSNTLDIITFSKEKANSKYCELDMLDVTVIHLPESSEKPPKLCCGHAYCSLGCL